MNSKRSKQLAEAWAHSRKVSEKLDEALAKRGQTVELGDIVSIDIPKDNGIDWAVIAKHKDDAELYLCVPADRFGFSGTPDVSVPDDINQAVCGPMALRCGQSLWIPKQLLEGQRIGVLETWHVDRASDKLEEVFAGQLSGSPDQQEWDADPGLEERLNEVSAIHAAVMEKIVDLSA